MFQGRPALFAAIALALGIVLGSNLSFSSVGILWFAGAVAVACGAIIIRMPAPRLVAIFLFFLFLGYCLTSFEGRSYRDTVIARIASLRPPKTVVVGTLSEIDETKHGYQWTFEVDSLGIARERPVRVHGNILLYLSNSSREHIRLPEVGSRLRVYNSLEPFKPATNPHEFASDLKLQTATRTEAQGEIHSRFDYYVLEPAQSNVWTHISSSIDGIHRSILSLLDSAIRDDNARGFVEAVVLGDRSDMSKETLNDFTASGVAHILAVSGFNVAIVSLVVAQLLRIFGIYWHRTRISLTMLMVLLYSAIVGFQPSVVRALMMIELYLVAQLLERKPDPLNIVMSAMAINLILRPFDLFDVGFQLSYAGVLGMVLVTPKILWLLKLDSKDDGPSRYRMLESRFVKQTGSAVALSVGASIASYPVIAAHFYRISFIGLAANVPLIPLSALITALGFLLIPLTALSHWLGQLYGDATGYLAIGLLALTKFFAHVLFASRAAGSPSVGFLTLFIIGVSYCLIAKTRRELVGRCTLVLALFFALHELGLPFSNSVLARNEGKLQVLFFDVGQGDCILLHTPSGKTYFVDFGKSDYDGNSVFERTALPFLRAENITDVEAGFISHLHVDHIGGAPALLENASVSTLFSSGERMASTAARELEFAARERKVETRILARGDTLHLDSGIVLYVLSPDRHVLASERTAFGQNIHSGVLAFQVRYGATSFLFLGDIERSEEEAMLSNYGSFLRSNVVKVSHHGSLTSSSKQFIEATNASYAVISVGEHNVFGHPAPAVIKRWLSSGSSICRTDRDGAVLLVSDGRTVHRVGW